MRVCDRRQTTRSGLSLMNHDRKNQKSPKGTGREPKKNAPDAESFSDMAGEIDGIEKLSSDDRRGPYRPEPTIPPTLTEQANNPELEPMQFPRPEEKLLARRPHLQRARFNRLRAGRIPFGLTLDLHGHNRDSGHRLLVETLQDASAARIECVLVIHGKGNRSVTGESVLRESMSEWLSAPSLRDIVLGFAPAQTRDGGRGAGFVLLS